MTKIIQTDPVPLSVKASSATAQSASITRQMAMMVRRL